jgi:ribonuclease HI
MERILVFTDGACSGNPGPGGWGAIVRTPDGRVRELGGGHPKTTNNRMEMTAALEALKLVAASPSEIDVFTDSTYVIHGITKWVHGWKKKGWVTASKAPVLNRDLWEALHEAAEGRRRKGPIEWRYVRGHTGNPGNERCDEIAVGFSKGERVELYDGPAGGYGHDLSKLPDEPPAAETADGKTTVPSQKGAAVYLSLVGGRLERHGTWAECNARVKGVPNARYKKASSPSEEKKIRAEWGVPELP